MKVFCYYKYDGGIWFRVFGFGLSIVDRNKHRALFAERNGYVKVLRLGKWSIKII